MKGIPPTYHEHARVVFFLYFCIWLLILADDVVSQSLFFLFFFFLLGQHKLCLKENDISDDECVLCSINHLVCIEREWEREREREREPSLFAVQPMIYVPEW